MFNDLICKTKLGELTRVVSRKDIILYEGYCNNIPNTLKYRRVLLEYTDFDLYEQKDIKVFVVA